MFAGNDMDAKAEARILNKKEKAAGLIVICCLFLVTVFVCIKKEKETYDYSFDLSKMSLYSAVFEDGHIHSKAPGDDYGFSSEPFILPPGKYVIDIAYSAEAASSLLVQGNNNCVFDIQLPPGDDLTVSDDRLILPEGTDRGKLKFSQEEEGRVDIYGITLHSATHIYRDYYLIIAAAFAIAVALSVILLNINRLSLTKRDLRYTALFFIVLILVNIPFFTKGLYYEIDTQAHLKRIEGIAQGIRDHQLPVIVGPNYANEYGELVVLNPDLFLYIPAILRLLNVSAPAAYNFFMILVNIATAVGALVCAERLFHSIRWSIVASIIYLLEPFRLYVMLNLGAGAGMGVAMVFLPFVATGIVHVLYNEGSRWKYLAVGLWGIACSHVMSLALAVLFLLIYTALHAKKLKDRKVAVALFKATVLFAMISVGMLTPFLSYYFTKWNRGAFAWTDFYHYPVELSRELMNIEAALLLVLAFFGLKKTGRFRGFLKEFVISGAVIIWMATRLFPWTVLGKLSFIDAFLEMMQYPFRFHLLAAMFIAASASASICANIDSKRAFGLKLATVAAVMIIAGTALNLGLYYSADMLFSDQVSGEMNTIMEDYLPEGTLTEWYETDTGEFSDYDAVKAYSYNKSNTAIDLTYTSSLEGQYMEFPLFYYKGYKAFDQDGRMLRLEKGEHNRVRVYLTCSDEIQELHVRFVVRRLYVYLFMFSIDASLIWFIWSISYLGYRAMRSHRITKTVS